MNIDSFLQFNALDVYVSLSPYIVIATSIFVVAFIISKIQLYKKKKYIKELTKNRNDLSNTYNKLLEAELFNTKKIKELESYKISSEVNFALSQSLQKKDNESMLQISLLKNEIALLKIPAIITVTTTPNFIPSKHIEECLPKNNSKKPTKSRRKTK